MMALLEGLNITGFLYTFVICLLITLVLFKWFRERNYPPGPTGIPILGYAPLLGKMPHEKLRDLGMKYGPIFSFYLGSELYICINEYQIAKDLLTRPDMLFRPPGSMDFVLGRGGINGMNGEEWQEQRRFTFYTMRNLGLGKGQWETLIKDNVEDLIEILRSWKGQPTNVEDTITNSQTNTSMSLLFGRHLDEKKDAETMKILRYSTREFMGYFAPLSVNSSVRWLGKVMGVLHFGGYERFFELLRQFENIFKKEVDERLKSPESLDRDDFIGCFFRELEKKSKETSNHTFTIENLMGNLLILFIAGNDSTMASLSWLFLILADRPDVQKKVYEEIDSVIGRDGTVTYDDRNKFPYTMATILEMTRWASVAPFFPPRFVTEDIACNGYIIPKGACVVSNAWAIMRDPKYFKNPDEFNPERFLTEDGAKVLTKVDGYLAFSLGKRNCPGEGVAIMTTFLYFVSIMQKFEVKMPPGKKADMEPVFGGVMLTKPQHLCFMER